MSQKLKSFLFLSSFVTVFAIYSFNLSDSNDYSDSNEIAVAELEETTQEQNLKIVNP